MEPLPICLRMLLVGPQLLASRGGEPVVADEGTSSVDFWVRMVAGALLGVAGNIGDSESCEVCAALAVEVLGACICGRLGQGAVIEVLLEACDIVERCG